MPPLVTISVVSHGDRLKISELIKSLRVHESMGDIELVVTDNFGNDIPDEKVVENEAIIILRNKKPQGFARNHNNAFRHASGKYFCVLNPDILFTQSVFSALILRLEQYDALISPLIFDGKNSLQDSFREFPSPLKLLKRKMPNYRFSPLSADERGLIHPDWIAGMFMFMRSDTYRLLGGFDEKFHLYFEDVDICARARVLGLIPLVDTTLRIQHNARRASRKKPRYLFWHLQSAGLFFFSDVYRELRKKGSA